MIKRTYSIKKNEYTIERLVTLFNSIPCFANLPVDWDELVELAKGESIDLVLQFRAEDEDTVNTMLEL